MGSMVVLQGTLDDIKEQQMAAFKKAGKEVARTLSSTSDSNKIANDIDKLLSRYPDSDKYQIMKYAFIAMC